MAMAACYEIKLALVPDLRHDRSKSKAALWPNWLVQQAAWSATVPVWRNAIRRVSA